MSRWEAADAAAGFTPGVGIALTGSILSAEDAIVPNYYTGSGAPAIECVTGRDFYIDSTAGALYFCKASGWQQASNSGHTHTANEIATGTLPIGVLPASVATTSQANAFAAGQRQSMGHNTSNAGLRLIPAAGDPAAAQDGDVWYNSSARKFRRMQNGSVGDWDTAAGGSSFDPLDRSVFWLVEEFPPSGNYPAGTNFVGTHRWGLTNATATAGGCTGIVPYTGIGTPGLLSVVIPATSGIGCAITLDQMNDTRLLGSLASVTWDSQWTFVPSIASTNFTFRAGLGNSLYSPAGSSSVECRIDPSVSANFIFALYTSGAQTASVDSGVVYNAGAASYTCRIRGDGARFYFSVALGNGAASAEKTLCPSGCDMTAALPAMQTYPFASLVTNEAAVKRIYLDKFAMKMTGLTR